ncbi:MAG: hypothetical protein AAF676_00675, partial [Pseudomonadota bacterium]
SGTATTAAPRNTAAVSKKPVSAPAVMVVPSVRRAMRAQHRPARGEKRPEIAGQSEFGGPMSPARRGPKVGSARVFAPIRGLQPPVSERSKPVFHRSEGRFRAVPVHFRTGIAAKPPRFAPNETGTSFSFRP